MLLTILIVPPPTSFLYLTRARSGSTPVVSQSIMKPIVPVGREHGRLRVPEPVLPARLERQVPHRALGLVEVLRHAGFLDLVCRVAVHRDDLEEGLSVPRVSGEGPELGRDPRGDQKRLAVHQARDGRRVVASVVAVVGEAVVHQERAEVRVAEPDRAEVVRVLLDGGRRVGGLVHEDLLRREDDVDGVAEALDVEAAVLPRELHQVQRGEVAGGVVDEHVLRAGVRRVDPVRRLARVPPVDRRVVLDPRVAADPGRLRHLAEERPRVERPHRLARRDGVRRVRPARLRRRA